MNVYTTEDPASIYTRGPGGVGERARPRWTPDNRIVILHGLRSDPKIKEYNRVSGDMEPDTSWTIEAVDSETSGKEEVLNAQHQDRTPGARSAVIDESDREEILYPRHLGATPLKPQSDFLITSNYDTPKRPLMPEVQHSTPSPSAFSQQTRNPRNHSSGKFELAQTGSRSLVQRVGLAPSTMDDAKDDKASARKHGNPNASTPSPRDGKGKERRRESAGLTTHASKSPPVPDKTPERHAVHTSWSSSSSNVGDGHPARRVHTPDLSRLPASPSPAMKQRPPRTPSTSTAQSPASPRPSRELHDANSPPNAPHTPLRGGGAQEGWSSLDDVATAEALRKLDRRAVQRARARVHSFGRPSSTAVSSPGSPAGRTSPPREAVDTSDSGKSKRGGGGAAKVSPFFLLRPLRKSSTRKDTQLSVPSPPLSSIVSTDGSVVKARKQVVNTPKTLDRSVHANHDGAAAPATSASANPPAPTARGLTSSVHSSRPKRLSPSAIPVFRRSSSQSAQPPPASASDALSSASQNTLSTNGLRSPAGSSAHDGSAGIAFSPPAKPAFPSKIVRKSKHQRSSSAPFPVPHPNGNTNASRPPSSSPHAPLSSSSTHTSPHAVPAPRVRRGYWNRRGDHLTPDGCVVYAPLRMAYPAELAAYPLEEAGYRDEKGGFVGYAERPELSASLPCKGRAPKRPYESFVVYVDDDSSGSLAPHWSSIDPFPRGLTPPKHTAKRPPHKRSPPTTTAKQELPKSDAAVETPSSTSAPPRPDPWDLDAILAAHRARRPRSPTSSSSSYGSAHSTRSRASSFSGSAGGHIPGTSRDVMAFPFGYPTSN